MTVKGQISHETTIWCGTCPEWNSQPGHGNAKRWRRAGWRMTLDYGWVCPTCSVRIKNGEDPEKFHDWTKEEDLQ